MSWYSNLNNGLRGGGGGGYAMRGLEDTMGWIGGLGGGVKGASQQMRRGRNRVIGGMAGVGLTGTGLYMRHRSSARNGLQGRSSGGY
jgi:hypothetical protein